MHREERDKRVDSSRGMVGGLKNLSLRPGKATGRRGLERVERRLPPPGLSPHSTVVACRLSRRSENQYRPELREDGCHWSVLTRRLSTGGTVRARPFIQGGVGGATRLTTMVWKLVCRGQAGGRFVRHLWPLDGFRSGFGRCGTDRSSSRER